MRRALPAVLATLGGLALLANFHTASGVKPRGVVAATTSTAPASGSGPPSSGTGSQPPTTTAASTGPRQIDGQPVATQFGEVQVRVLLDNGKISDVQPLQMPFDHRRSLEISQQVAPLLHDEVLQAQSAQIDLVSGATYTSYAYRQSLQAALDQGPR
jgi:uncharacterized protein with FMN-binding domain